MEKMNKNLDPQKIRELLDKLGAARVSLKIAGERMQEASDELARRLEIHGVKHQALTDAMKELQNYVGVDVPSEIPTENLRGFWK